MGAEGGGRSRDFTRFGGRSGAAYAKPSQRTTLTSAATQVMDNANIAM
jgi:hypothetical protein